MSTAIVKKKYMLDSVHDFGASPLNLLYPPQVTAVFIFFQAQNQYLAAIVNPFCLCVQSSTTIYNRARVVILAADNV